MAQHTLLEELLRIYILLVVFKEIKCIIQETVEIGLYFLEYLHTFHILSLLYGQTICGLLVVIMEPLQI